MATESETIADIIAEKRRRADEIECDCAEKMKCGEMTSDQYARELVADIRKEADRLEAARKRMEWTHKKELETKDAVIQTEVATREAEQEAHKREVDGLKKQVGDVAKLREAMRLVSRVAEQMTRGTITGEAPTRKEVNDWAMRLCDIIGAALAAPPRNCDVYDNESCRMAYHLHGDGLMTMQAFADWLFAPATEQEGGAK